jgi:hypothetical protein
MEHAHESVPLMAFQTVKKFPEFYGTHRFMSFFTVTSYKCCRHRLSFRHNIHTRSGFRLFSAFQKVFSSAQGNALLANFFILVSFSVYSSTAKMEAKFCSETSFHFQRIRSRLSQRLISSKNIKLTTPINLLPELRIC